MTALPSNLTFTRRAERDLEGVTNAEAERIIEDMARIANRTFPGEIKPIATLPGRPLQADAGRFRVLFHWVGATAEILAVFPKSAQRRIFRGMK